MRVTTLSALLALLAAAPLIQNPSPAKPPAQDPPAKPEESQESLAAKRRLAAQALEEADFFGRCDQNANGWISLHEGREALGMDSSTFRSYDTDLDGRISREEFAARYKLSVSRVGAFKPPASVPKTARAPTRNAEQLRNAYDKNADGGLSADELKLVLDDYERSELPAEIALEKLDRDGSTRIDGAEIDFLARLLTTNLSPAAADPNAPRVRQTLEELFGGLRDRTSGFHSAPMPPEIVGPVTHFRRLDLDGDGRVSIDDLRRLQAPLQLPVRAAAVLAALDLDGDGVMSPTEFSAAVGN